MTAFIFADNVNTTLGAAASSSATTLTLASSANLPTLGTGQQMPLTLNDAATGLVYEIVYVTAISGATLTVIRAQEGTTAQNWSVGDYAACMHTAQTTASINGNALQPFEAAAAVDPTGVVNLSQVVNAAPVQAVSASTTATSVTATTGTFTAPCDGWLMCYGYGQSGTTGTSGAGLSLTLAGLVSPGLDATAYGIYQTGYLPMTTGQQSTVSFNATAGSATALDAFVSAFFIPNP